MPVIRHEAVQVRDTSIQPPETSGPMAVAQVTDRCRLIWPPSLGSRHGAGMDSVWGVHRVPVIVGATQALLTTIHDPGMSVEPMQVVVICSVICPANGAVHGTRRETVEGMHVAAGGRTTGGGGGAMGAGAHVLF